MRLWPIAAAAALAAAPVYAQQKIVKIDGSSTVFPVTEAVAEDFQKAKKQQVKVTVGISGTGGGFKKFCRTETDISNASRPILKAEMAECKTAGIEYNFGSTYVKVLGTFDTSGPAPANESRVSGLDETEDQLDRQQGLAGSRGAGDHHPAGPQGGVVADHVARVVQGGGLSLRRDPVPAASRPEATSADLDRWPQQGDQRHDLVGDSTEPQRHVGTTLE